MFHLRTYYVVHIKYKRCKSVFCKTMERAFRRAIASDEQAIVASNLLFFWGIFYSYLLLARRVSWVGESASRTHFHRKRRDSNRKIGLNSCREVAKAFVKSFHHWDRLILPSNADHSWKQPSYPTISSLVDNYNVGLVLQSVGLQVWFITCWPFQRTWESAAPNTRKPAKVLWLTVVQSSLFYLDNWLCLQLRAQAWVQNGEAILKLQVVE